MESLALAPPLLARSWTQEPDTGSQRGRHPPTRPQIVWSGLVWFVSIEPTPDPTPTPPALPHAASISACQFLVPWSRWDILALQGLSIRRRPLLLLLLSQQKKLACPLSVVRLAAELVSTLIFPSPFFLSFFLLTFPFSSTCGPDSRESLCHSNRRSFVTRSVGCSTNAACLAFNGSELISPRMSSCADS